MNAQERKAYAAPAIVLEMELETCAGTGIVPADWEWVEEG